MNTFKTLLLREWMQHHRAWFILGLLPLVLALLSIGFGQVQIDDEVSSPGLLLAFAGGYTGVVMAIALFATLLMSPGMARRDWSDRSIEFWLSLPVAHWQAVAAWQLAHTLLLPLLALALALAGALPVAALFTARVFGAAELMQLPWGSLVLAAAVVSVRLVLGLVLGMLWLAPITMAMDAAAVWLKGWGPVALVAVVATVGGVLVAYTGNRIVFDTVREIAVQALAAMVPWSGSGTADPAQAVMANGPGVLPAMAWADLGTVLRDLAHPLFAAGLVVAAIGFWLQVLRRRRGA